MLILDIHGEYATALSDRATIFKINPDVTKAEKQLCVPFWALNFDEFCDIAFGGIEGRGQSVVSDMILELKRAAINNFPKPGVSNDSVSADTPVPFCVHKMWLDLHSREHLTVIPAPGGATDEKVPAYVLNTAGQPIQIGDALSVTPPQYRNVKTTGTATERVQLGNEGVGIRQQLAGLASKLRDPRFGFMFRPSGWLPQINGQTQCDLEDLLADWIGGVQPVTILDLSGIPSSILNQLIGALLRILYDALFWGKNLPEGGRERPLLVVLEEAHNYLGKGDSNTASRTVRKIAKEGRKYGVGMMIVSQRPSEIDSTILSQCGTLFAMRLSNDLDRGQVKSIVSDNLTGLFEMLPVLRTGEAIIVGESVSLPVRTLIDPPAKNRRPDSIDPRVVARKGKDGDGLEAPGGWNQQRDGQQSYAVEIEQWRRQSPRYEHGDINGQGPIATLQAVAPDWTMTPESSTLSRIRYEAASQVLTVDFRSAGIYEFYEVPANLYQEMIESNLKGDFLSERIRGHFRYAKT
ncbi:helicase HerA-like domain-containing protein [Granulicella sp. S190]|uniref:helicase HerA-like domain-containing protein n=1 Tax=Granulicella sp. S190 TaxID=1747226 RepID=UPI00352B08E1